MRARLSALATGLIAPALFISGCSSGPEVSAKVIDCYDAGYDGWVDVLFTNSSDSQKVVTLVLDWLSDTKDYAGITLPPGESQKRYFIVSGFRCTPEISILSASE